jgi:hypothetical protein
MSLPVSDLEIINLALIELGKPTVDAVDATDDSVLLSFKLDILLPVMLLAAPWNFGVKFRQDNTPLTTPFSPEYLYAYQLPADFGSFFRFLTNYYPISYQFADGMLLTSQRPIQYYYIVNAADPGALSTLFVRAVSIFIAADSCMVLTQNENLTKYLQAKYLESKSDAILFNDIQREIWQAPNDFDRTYYY